MTLPALKGKLSLALATSLVVQMIGAMSSIPQAEAMGPVPIPAPVHPLGVHGAHRSKTAAAKVHHYPGSVKISHGKGKSSKKKKAAKKTPPPKPPQDLVGQMSSRTIAPGVVHKVHRGAMFINLLDIDLAHAGVQVKPVLAGERFDCLDEVKDQAHKVNAIAAINGNYFKRDGTPLGTLIIDGEWIAGPLYDRTCMGVTRDGRILVDRVSLHGTLETSNPAAPNIWVNNINQPRRHGCHLIAYTRRWGNAVHMAYEGTLVAVDSTGRVTDKAAKVLAIPYGGYVFSDSKDSPLSQLNVGDLTNLTWHVTPGDWSDVTNAVSGGPVLIRDGKIFLDLQDEGFRKSWTSNSIHARTAVGVTANRHLLLATIEGPHTLWDVAKFLHKLGAVEAMNLDGGGSTTMVIDGVTVTRNQNAYQRRVASSLAVLARKPGQDFADASEGTVIYQGATRTYVPTSNILDLGAQLPQESLPTNRNSYELVNTQPASVGTPQPGSSTVASGQIQPERTSAADPAMKPVADVQPVEKKGSRYFGWMHHLNPLSR